MFLSLTTRLFLASLTFGSLATMFASLALSSVGTVQDAVTAVTASGMLTPGIGLPILTGSVILSGSTLTGVIGETANLDPSIPTSSFLGANVDYRAFRDGAARQGILLATWLGGGSSEISFTDASSADIGDTSDISFSFILTGPNAHLRITSTGSGPDTWTVQTYFRLFPKF